MIHTPQAYVWRSGASTVLQKVRSFSAHEIKVKCANFIYVALLIVFYSKTHAYENQIWKSMLQNVRKTDTWSAKALSTYTLAQELQTRVCSLNLYLVIWYQTPSLISKVFLYRVDWNYMLNLAHELNVKLAVKGR